MKSELLILFVILFGFILSLFLGTKYIKASEVKKSSVIEKIKDDKTDVIKVNQNYMDEDYIDEDYIDEGGGRFAHFTHDSNNNKIMTLTYNNGSRITYNVTKTEPNKYHLSTDRITDIAIFKNRDNKKIMEIINNEGNVFMTLFKIN